MAVAPSSPPLLRPSSLDDGAPSAAAAISAAHRAALWCVVRRAFSRERAASSRPARLTPRSWASTPVAPLTCASSVAATTTMRAPAKAAPAIAAAVRGGRSVPVPDASRPAPRLLGAGPGAHTSAVARGARHHASLRAAPSSRHTHACASPSAARREPPSAAAEPVDGEWPRVAADGGGAAPSEGSGGDAIVVAEETANPASASPSIAVPSGVDTRPDRRRAAVCAPPLPTVLMRDGGAVMLECLHAASPMAAAMVVMAAAAAGGRVNNSGACGGAAVAAGGLVVTCASQSAATTRATTMKYASR